jgi:lipopolysaccharide/colanic/teichoic acid biosynthesis glycosyltransferase
VTVTIYDLTMKRAFDVALAAAGLVLAWWMILIAFVLATIDTGTNGLFFQSRIGRHGKPFKLIKIRTMKPSGSWRTTVTTENDPRITPLGRILRKCKIDEVPQLFNVLLGQMSFVGPRPDVAGFADCLEGEDRVILNVRPGITGPATLKYRAEEKLLAGSSSPEDYNREIIFPDKVRINRYYIENYRFRNDLLYIAKTIFR